MSMNGHGNCDEIATRLFGCQELARKGMPVVCGVLCTKKRKQCAYNGRIQL
jgi:hypothetical protein